ncbi:L-ascorbate metabolism protein UlaG, beta-lactamase superfamily [Paramicrobacterium humi]|uniref:L-ascorbate metabolism protein UlaG, beta-lactamase superfamily n=1 Tax=Paramicrobacterium humi TaxID=640635 RepID=A0A1H4TID6_9MICO|nr:MBL fold metallo-hydrolase [Microbacterium humi]SEC56038.1 L-ascorbate metabolism protein UlaG, beta-lactamase superfamily [Microbacterium humi]
MKLTKLEHAAFTVDEASARLYVDPGAYTTPLTDTVGTVAVVITHEHADHWTPEQLDRILASNPDVRIFAPAGVAKAASDYEITVVEAGDEFTVEPFTLRFFGGKHAVIHPSIPVVDNVGVLINGVVYYGGDSFYVPDGVDVDVMAVPAGAPWLKISEVMDFVAEVAPKRSFPTHEMVLSRIGKNLSNDRIASVVEQGGGEHIPLEPGESIEV